MELPQQGSSMRVVPEDVCVSAGKADDVQQIMREQIRLEQESWWEREPEDVSRVAFGVKSRVDRLTALGNGQVPAVVAGAWEALRR